MKKQINVANAPKAIGPYSQAIQIGDFIFISGQISIDPQSGEVVRGDIKTETSRVLNNIKAILEGAGCKMTNIVKTTVYMTDLSEFSSFNEEYEKFFRDSVPPARATVQVSKLPKDVKIEIDAIAYIDKYE